MGPYRVMVDEFSCRDSFYVGCCCVRAGDGSGKRMANDHGSRKWKNNAKQM